MFDSSNFVSLHKATMEPAIDTSKTPTQSATREKRATRRVKHGNSIMDMEGYWYTFKVNQFAFTRWASFKELDQLP